jgi:hypothetical protein
MTPLLREYEPAVQVRCRQFGIQGRGADERAEGLIRLAEAS